ncbi:MAG: hypothetical protein KJ971_08615 [Firmicutes bacterium]|nr:hypothetical protein [Bacillota bacterium]
MAELNSIVHCLLKPSWIFPILKRDDYTCQICNKHGGDLEVHHLRPYHKIRDAVLESHPKLNPDIFEEKRRIAFHIMEDHTLQDGITLCVRCHSLAHNTHWGELLETPNNTVEDNQQPSLPKLSLIVGGKVQRSMGEDSTTNKPDTSAPLVVSLQREDMI